jgi:DNA-binding transcriptional MerR regulator
MTISEVCAEYNIRPDTLRYYERVGIIPDVTRTPGRIRDYGEEDIRWVEKAICMRNAGVPVEMLAEYVKLYRQGDETIEARMELLKEARARIVEVREKCDTALERLDYKIGRYEMAMRTGVLTWD